MTMEVIPDPAEAAIQAAYAACPQDRRGMPLLDRRQIDSLVRSALTAYLDGLRDNVD